MRDIPHAPPTTRSTTEPQFLTVAGRRLFALKITPTGPVRGALLYLPPFAEEMNRCRSHAVAQARALAAIGYTTLILDPSGTGESDGEITDPDWATWQADAIGAAQWLAAQSRLPLTLWGVRTGALLVADVADSGQVAVDRLLFWQPVLDGALFINQHLRLRLASLMVHDGERETSETIRARLAAGEAVEIAGYPLSGRMADSLAARKLAASSTLARHRLAWIEMAAKAEQPLGPASRKLLDALASAGAPPAQTAVAAGPLIWQLQEREDAPALMAATVSLMEATA
jgi:exosortase A-associated hydrolase 2